MFSLLKDGLFRVRLKDSSASELSLPQVYEAMSRDEVSAFVALRPHQRHAWHAFLAQLGAMACHQAGIAKPPTAAAEWHKLIQSLTPDFPDDEPWCLLVDDLSKPAFMQSPLAGELAEYKKSFRYPDDIDVLVTAKNHEIKKSIALKSNFDDWIFALVCLQTMSGCMGRRNYGIARMNGLSANRPCLGLRPSEGGVGAHLFHDIAGMLATRERLCNDYPDYFDTQGLGHKLLWMLPWQGKDTECLPLKELDVYFIEICRRLRLVLSKDGHLLAKVGNSDAMRVGAQAAHGNVGDYWTPVKTKDKEITSYTLSEMGFDYKQLKKILFDLGYCRPAPAMNIPSCTDSTQWRLVARGYAGGQGKTKGYHERNDIMLDGKTIRTFVFGSDNNDRKNLAEISENIIKEIDFIRKALSSAIDIVASGGKVLASDNKSSKSRKKHAVRFSVRLERFADTLFFPQVQKRFTAPENDGTVANKFRLEFLCLMIMHAEQLLIDAISAVPCAGVFRYRASVEAENDFFGRLYGSKSEFADLSADIKAEIYARRGRPAPKNATANSQATAA